VFFKYLQRGRGNEFIKWYHKKKKQRKKKTKYDKLPYPAFLLVLNPSCVSNKRPLRQVNELKSIPGMIDSNEYLYPVLR
jgi:hypothetical protein